MTLPLRNCCPCTSGQYQAAIGNALQDSRRIINLIDGLLNLAKADYQSEQITMEEVRLDELLLDARFTKAVVNR